MGGPPASGQQGYNAMLPDSDRSRYEVHSDVRQRNHQDLRGNAGDDEHGTLAGGNHSHDQGHDATSDDDDISNNQVGINLRALSFYRTQFSFLSHCRQSEPESTVTAPDPRRLVPSTQVRQVFYPSMLQVITPT